MVLEQLVTTEVPANAALMAALAGAHTVLTEQFDRYAAGQDADGVDELVSLLDAAMADAVAEHQEVQAAQLRLNWKPPLIWWNQKQRLNRT